MSDEWKEQESNGQHDMTMDQMVLGLMWELQALRQTVMVMNQTMIELMRTLRED